MSPSLFCCGCSLSFPPLLSPYPSLFSVLLSPPPVLSPLCFPSVVEKYESRRTRTRKRERETPAVLLKHNQLHVTGLAVVNSDPLCLAVWDINLLSAWFHCLVFGMEEGEEKEKWRPVSLYIQVDYSHSWCYNFLAIRSVLRLYGFLRGCVDLVDPGRV